MRSNVIEIFLKFDECKAGLKKINTNACFGKAAILGTYY